MDLLHFTLLNLEHGALVTPPAAPHVVERGHHDFGRLQRLLRNADPAPHVIGICEAKEWGLWGGAALHRAATVLSELLGRAYVGLQGSLTIGLFGPALFYDAATLALEYWGDDDLTVPADRRNLARLHVRSQPRSRFGVVVDHWPHWAWEPRLERAQFMTWIGYDQLPMLYIGDLNGTASGPHLPQRDWNAPGLNKQFHKGIQLPDGRWVAATAPVDHLLGTWVPHPSLPGAGERQGGNQFYAVEEAAGTTGPQAQAALVATVNDGVERGGGLLIDWALHNEAWRCGAAPGSVRVDIPPADQPRDSDHRAKHWSMYLP